jgi:transposase-like protein
MRKCISSYQIVTNGKKQRKSITPKEKLDVIKRYECNICMVEIANAMGILRSTLRIIRKQALKVKESCKSVMRIMASKTTQIMAPVNEETGKDAGSVH